MEKQELKQTIEDNKQVDCCATNSCCGSENDVGKSDDGSDKDVRCC